MLLKNISFLVAGTAGAQLLALSFIPIITRLYGPDEFGLLGVFLAIFNVIGQIVCLTLPSAIVIAGDDDEAVSVSVLSLLIGCVLILIISLALLLTDGSLLRFVGAASLSNFWYVISIALFFFMIFQIVLNWSIRNQTFKYQAFGNLLQHLIDGVTKMAIGIIYPKGYFLILITSFGYLLNAIVLILKSTIVSAFRLNKISKSKLKSSLNKFKDFPLYRAPEHLLNHGSQSLPVLFLASFHSPVYAGLYSLAVLVLSAPTQLIGRSVSDVFFSDFAQRLKDGRSLKGQFSKSIFWLTVLGLLPFSFVYVWGAEIFELVFGADWSVAGTYAAMLSPWLFTIFITSTCISIVPVIRAQRFNFYFAWIKMIFRAGAIYFGYKLKLDVVSFVLLFSLTGTFINIAYLFLVFFLIKRAEQKVQGFT